MNKKQWRKANNWYKENKNLEYWVKNILLYIFFPLRMAFIICPYCHELAGDISYCKCISEEHKEMLSRLKKWKLNYDIHCVWCSTKEKKLELVITKLEEYGHDGYPLVGWSSKCPKCKDFSCTSGGRRIPKKVRELYNKQSGKTIPSAGGTDE